MRAESYMPNFTNTKLMAGFASLSDHLDNICFIGLAHPDKCGTDHLRILCREAIRNAKIYPDDKLCRWYGFIIGVMSDSKWWGHASTLDSLYPGALSLRQVDVMRQLLNRYLAVVAETPVACHLGSVQKDLNDVIREALASVEKSTFESLSIRLGYIQGVLAVKGLISVDEEREFTRPLLHSLHDQPIPTYAPGK